MERGGKNRSFLRFPDPLLELLQFGIGSKDRFGGLKICRQNLGFKVIVHWEGCRNLAEASENPHWGEFTLKKVFKELLQIKSQEK